MDEQKLTQMLNEQSLVNLSIIEQLNQQAGYLHSIVERLERLTNFLMEHQPEHRERPQSVTFPPLEEESEPKEEDTETDSNLFKAATLTNRNAFILDETTIKTIKENEPNDQAEDAEVEEIIEPFLVEEDDTIVSELQKDDLVPDVNDIFLFGDRIRVITDNFDQTGLFIELNDEYLVWVIDDAQITFTNIIGATIIRLS